MAKIMRFFLNSSHGTHARRIYWELLHLLFNECSLQDLGDCVTINYTRVPTFSYVYELVDIIMNATD